ncbi:MAG: prolyl oligopeptidase family serine peptidase [Prolixibacteraceae bacterium]
MKKILIFAMTGLTVLSCKKAPVMSYPETRKEAVVDTFYGTPVEDPYRWLEDDNSEETAQWVERQNEVTFTYLNGLPGRDTIKARLTALMDYPKISAPFKRAGKYFFGKNDGLQNQSVIYMSESLHGDARILLDPNTLSDDGTIALSGMEITPDGKYMIYMISKSGSDWNEIFVKNIETGEILPDHIKWVKFSSTSWYDGGFFYSCYNAPEAGNELSKSNENHLVKYHKLGTDPATDPLIASDPEHPKRNMGAGLTRDKRFMFLYKTESTSGNSLAFKEMNKKDGPFIPLMESFEHDFNIIDNIDDQLLVLTNYKAPNYRILKIDSRNPQEEFWTELVPEKEQVLRSANLAGGKLVLNYLKDAFTHIEICHYDGSLDYEFPLPGIGTTGGLSGDKDDPEAFYTFSSYNTPGEVYRYDFSTKESALYFRPEVKFNPDDFQVEQVFYTSKDGTKIPMFLFYKKGMVKNGGNPVLLYGYGGFNVSQTPQFSVSRFFFAENGGILAVANLRGGGEYGESWHKAGTKLQKQNVFDDFIAAAEYLINNKYTSSRKLAIQGGSNGGLLVGAVANQRPELFKVALPAVGVMDMLRYHKFTIGWAWATDYGTPEESEEMFNYLLTYSPYHSMKPGIKYPATLVTTADHDDRVVPSHSFKFISRLQEYNTGKLPVLIRIETKAGHGAGKPTAKVIDEQTDIWAFTFHHLGITL